MKVDNIIKAAAKKGYRLKVIMTTYNGERHVLAYKNMQCNKYNSFNDFYNRVLKTERI